MNCESQHLHMIHLWIFRNAIYFADANVFWVDLRNVFERKPQTVMMSWCSYSKFYKQINPNFYFRPCSFISSGEYMQSCSRDICFFWWYIETEFVNLSISIGNLERVSQSNPHQLYQLLPCFLHFSELCASNKTHYPAQNFNLMGIWCTLW